jgi:hypothetical protein
MSKTRRLLFCTGAVLLLVLIAGLMLIVGRGHTVYLDNKTMEYNGQTYDAFYKVEVVQKGKTLTKLDKRDRGMATNIGQNFKITLIITKEKNGTKETKDIQFKLPYSMDGIILNLPGYLAGLPEEAYLEEFISTAEPEAGDESDISTEDEFGFSTDSETAP